jgi:hypothetical protein
MSVEAVREQLVMVTALRDNQAIDGSLTPDQRTRQRADLSAAAIYAQRNRITKE